MICSGSESVRGRKCSVSNERSGGRRPPLQEVEWEVLPPEAKSGKQVEPLFRWIALLMDNLLRIPGTRFRFGIDPLIGLIPGLGDTSSAMVSALALIQAARHGLPKIVLARMSVNILLNELIGIVPVVGDAFSFWFKSNARNYALLQQHTGATRRSTTSDWLFVAAVLGALIIILLVSLAFSFWLLSQVAALFNRR